MSCETEKQNSRWIRVGRRWIVPGMVVTAILCLAWHVLQRDEIPDSTETIAEQYRPAHFDPDSVRDALANARWQSERPRLPKEPAFDLDSHVTELVEFGPEAAPILSERVREAPVRSVEMSLCIVALGRIGDSRGLPALLEATAYRGFTYLNDEDLCNAVTEFGPAAIADLLPLVEEGPAFRRARVMRVLCAIADESTTDVFLKSIRCRDRPTILPALEALTRLGHLQPAERDLLALLDAEWQRWKQEDRPGESEQTIRRLLSTLSRIGSESCENRLISIATDKDSRNWFRADAVSALGRVGSDRAIEILMDLLHEPEEGPNGLAVPQVVPSEFGGGIGGPAAGGMAILPLPLHSHVIDALSSVGTNAVPPLLEIAEDLSQFPGQRALLALALMSDSDPRVETSLIDAAFNEDLPQIVRHIVIDGLGRIATPRCRETLISALSRPELPLWIPILESLVTIGDAVRKPMLDRLSSPNEHVRSRATSVLARVGDDRDFDQLAIAAAELSSGDTAVNEVIQLAERTGDRRFTELLLNTAEHGNGWSSSQAIEAISQWPDVDRERVGAIALKRLPTDEYRTSALLTVLGRVGADDAVRVATDFLEAPEPPEHSEKSILQAAASVLAFHDPSRLVELIRDSDSNALYALEAFRDHKENPFAEAAVLAALRKEQSLVAPRGLGLRHLALDIIQEWKWRGAADALLEELRRESDESRRDYLGQALAGLGDARAIPVVLAGGTKFGAGYRSLRYFEPDALFEAWETDPHPALLDTLAVFGNPRAIPHLKKILDDPERSAAHQLAVENLGRFYSANNVERLIERLKSPGRMYRSVVVESLLKIPRPDVIARVAPILADTELMADPDFNREILTLLFKMGTPEAAELLMRRDLIIDSDLIRDRVQKVRNAYRLTQMCTDPAVCIGFTTKPYF